MRTIVKLLSRAAALFALPWITLATGPALSADGWQEAAAGAVAILPKPSKAVGIVGASLHCAQQRWTFLLRLAPGTLPAGSRSPAKFTIGGEPFVTVAVETGGIAVAEVPADILQPLRAASRMGVQLEAAGTIPSAIFELKGSSAVLDAVEPRCTPVDMSPYQSIVLSEADAAVQTAISLLADEAKLFRAATGRKPVYAAATTGTEAGGTLLFASICGSNSYYGRSGCSLFGFAQDAADWRQVYNTEGATLYLDPADRHGGYPALVTLPAGGTEPSHWTWNGEAYVIRERGVEEASVPEEASDTAQ